MINRCVNLEQIVKAQTIFINKSIKILFYLKSENEFVKTVFEGHGRNIENSLVPRRDGVVDSDRSQNLFFPDLK
jgi:hypothetical protein